MSVELSIGKIIDSMECVVEVCPPDPDKIIDFLTWDSREVKSGCAFLAIEGSRVDGNDFIVDVLDHGVLLAIATRKPKPNEIQIAKKSGGCIVVVDDAEKAISQIALKQRECLSAKVIGVTGSSGKTTTKDIISKVMQASFNTVCTAANKNNELGVPATVLSANSKTEALIVEMGMRGFGQLESLCDFVKPDIGVITNIGTAHVELLGSQDNIAKAKAELITSLPEGSGIAVLNGDDPYTDRVIEVSQACRRGISIIKYGICDDCDVRAENIEYTKDGRPSFDIVTKEDRAHCELVLMGTHNVSNALCAAAVGLVSGIEINKICSALENAKNASMRQETVFAKCGVLVINDAYNANYDSMSAALSLLSIMDTNGRKIAVLGDMLELGDEAQRLHFKTGEIVVKLGIDELVAIGDLGEEIARGAKQKIAETGNKKTNVYEYLDVNKATDFVSSLVEQDDVVLVKASRGMQLERVVKGLVG